MSKAPTIASSASIPAAQKTIATINFKGGVGKTTMTFCLAEFIATYTNRRALVFDLDAQMSLTQAVTLRDEDGDARPEFAEWYAVSRQSERTLYHALMNFAQSSGHFDFPVEDHLIFPTGERLSFVPSVPELYLLELEQLNRQHCLSFLGRLLGRIHASPDLPRYDYALLDCPPSFTTLSASALHSCDLVLIPFNPDFFAAEGTKLILQTMLFLAPHPAPKIAVFMNKSKTAPLGGPIHEAKAYLRGIRDVCAEAAADGRLNVRLLETYVPERAGIGRAIQNGLPGPLVDDLKALWTEITDFIHE